MNKKEHQQERPVRYTRAWPVVTMILAVLTLFLGWRVANIVNPQRGLANGPAIEYDGHDYLVYRSVRVLSQGVSSDPSENFLSYEFFRYPLDGSAARNESILRVTRSGGAIGYGEPEMRRIADSTMLFLRRETGPDDLVWIDVSGREMESSAYGREATRLSDSLPSPDGGSVVYYDDASSQLVLEYFSSGSVASFSSPEPVSPLGWLNESVVLVYGKQVDSPVTYYRFDTTAGQFETDAVLTSAQLLQPVLSASRAFAVGFQAGEAGPSLVAVNLDDGRRIELVTNNEPSPFSYFPFANPRVSPNDSLVAYTRFDDGRPSVWVTGLNRGGEDRRVISGQFLDWTADGNTLVVDRDNELQLVSIDDGKVTTVVRRVGDHDDPDYHGVDYVGIVSKR